MYIRRSVFILFILSFLISGCAIDQKPALKIDYEKFILDNGLEVILHQDKSDPIVSVAIQYHVGSNREKKGRTGLAHLFEHMLFQESQHVGQDQFFKKIEDAGGTLNGGTWNDGTIYYEVVPKNALEMVLWLESDRMGFLLSTVTQEAFENQQSVVQNEKRQAVDNVPYGHTEYIIGKLLYPENHPYNWQVIGSFEDLQNTTIEDVHNFFKTWYGPNNATLVLAGDYDKVQTVEWIKKYFGELKASPPITDAEPQHVQIPETKRAFHQDDFAQSPELNMIFPSVENYHQDSYALDMLGELLSEGKKAPLYQVMVEDKKLAPSVSAFQNSLEIAGEFRFTVRAFPDINLSEVEKAIFEALEKFEQEKFTDMDLARIKAKIETNFYNGISSVLGKSFQLAIYNEYAGSPDFITRDIQNSLDVTETDIWRVYNQYIKGKNFILTSFVPKSKLNLVAENSQRYPITEDKILTDAQKPKSTASEKTIEKIASGFDRSVEPGKGPTPEITIPDIWTHSYQNGLKIFGIEHKELPLVQFSLTIKGGLLMDNLNKVGVANLITDLMMEGTKNKTPLELEEAIDDLGSSISMFTGNESITIRVNTLSSNLENIYKLFEEILLEPRWDTKEFERVKLETIETINRRSVNPSSVASNVYLKLLYGSKHALGHSTLGTEKSVSNIRIADLQNYYNNNFSQSIAHISIVGNISKSDAVDLFSPIATKWSTKEVRLPEYPKPPALKNSKLFFVDIPGARQSQIRIGYLALPFSHPDYYAATVMNYKLGGNFNSFVNMVLREEKGYTYGAFSNFSGFLNPGPFTATSAVQSKTTLESVQIFKDLMTEYRNGLSDADLEFTKNALIQSNSRKFETLGALIGMLNQIATHDLSFDFVKEQEITIKNMTKQSHKELAQKYILPAKMVYLIVGDAKTQMAGLSKIGFGSPVLLDRNGDPVK